MHAYLPSIIINDCTYKGMISVQTRYEFYND